MLYMQGNLKEAIPYNNEARDLSLKLSYKRGLANAYNNYGNIYNNQGNYPEALKNHFNSLKIREEIGYKRGVAASYCAIGNVYANQGSIEEAEINYKKGLEIFREINEEIGLADTYVALGILSEDQAESETEMPGKKAGLQKALSYYIASLNVYVAIADSQRLALSYNNIGNVYDVEASLFTNKDSMNSRYELALKYQKMAMEIQENTGNDQDLPLTYNNIAGIYLEQKKYPDAIVWTFKGLAMARIVNSLLDVQIAEKGLSDIYLKLNEPQKAFDHYVAYINIRDSIFNEENTRQTVKSQMQYEFGKKQAADSVKVADDRKITDAQLAQEQTQRYALYGGLLLTFIFALFMFNRFRVTRRQKELIEIQKHQVEKAKDIVVHQKLLIEEKQKEVMDSIHYAQKIQRALLPTEKYIIKNLTRLQNNS